MNIKAQWSEPVALENDRTGKLIYTINLNDLPDRPGVYIFYRKHGSKFSPIYIGQSTTLKKRIKTHLNSLALMQAIKHAAKGKRFLIYCTMKTNSPDKASKQIKIIEKALIIHAQNIGHELFNTKGTKRPTDEIVFSGNRNSESLAPRKMRITQALTKTK